MKILADASLPGLSKAFPKPFELTLYHQNKEAHTLLTDQNILLCRSTLKVNEELLQGHSLDYVATASSGTDHIDKAYLKAQAIQLIDAKGSNAIAVADYVIATLAYLQRVKRFSGSKAGVIGVGEVGSRVVHRLKAAGMTVFSYDPLKATADTHFISHPFTTLVDCDLLAIHANLHDNLPYPSRDLINADLLNQLKPGVVIINASRGGIVNEQALLSHQHALLYCTDVYDNEPTINSKIVELATLCTPHIAGHSIEAKYTAIALISNKIHFCYHLKPPSLPRSAKIKPNQRLSLENWQNLILSLYNPFDETSALKRFSACQANFIPLRKAHQFRHDFCNYEIQTNDQLFQALLGDV